MSTNLASDTHTVLTALLEGAGTPDEISDRTGVDSLAVVSVPLAVAAGSLAIGGVFADMRNTVGRG